MMNRLNILVVDDDPTTRELLRKNLSRAGHKVAVASNGGEAVETNEEKTYDVVLSDLMMPGSVDGIGVLEAFKSRSPQTEVILITAHASVENAVAAMKKGAADYLQKPINFDELHLKLNKVSTMKFLAKDATELREAMEVTESTAAETIQSLEIVVSQIQGKCSEVEKILLDEFINAKERIKQALDVLGA